MEALQTVLDPQTGRDVVSLRMVENLQVNGKDISFTLVLPAMKAGLKNELNFACIGAVAAVYPQAEVHVHVRTETEKAAAEPNSPVPQIRNIIAVASGKGGVGKSTVSVNLALGLAALGAKVGLMDCDLYGPSIPTMFGLQGIRPRIEEINGQPKIVPIEKYGIPTISIGYIIEPEQAVVLRGPRLGAIIKQFFMDCIWPDLDYLVIDLPPGTGDVQLSLVQTVPINGAVLVTTPQTVALADAVKAMNMFLLPNINVPIVGVVENMSWFTPAELPHNKYYLFGQGGGKQLSKMANTVLLGQIPLVQSIREGGDTGKPAMLDPEDSPVRQAFLGVAQNAARQMALRHELGQ